MKELSAFKRIRLLKCCDIGSRMTHFGLSKVNYQTLNVLGRNAVSFTHSVNLYIRALYTGYTQKNGAVLKLNKKFISHLSRVKRTPSAAAAVQVSPTLPAVRFSCLLRGREVSFQVGVAAGKGFLCAPFRGCATSSSKLCTRLKIGRAHV
jgi:hypothetical protein